MFICSLYEIKLKENMTKRKKHKHICITAETLAGWSTYIRKFFLKTFFSRTTKLQHDKLIYNHPHVNGFKFLQIVIHGARITKGVQGLK